MERTTTITRDSIFMEALKILIPEAQKHKVVGQNTTYDSLIADAIYIADVSIKELEKES